MEEYSIEALTGNPDLEAAEILDRQREEVGFSSAALPDSPDLEREMAEAFGWDVPPTEEELEEQYAAAKCDEAELLAKYPGLRDQPDDFLISLIADPPALMEDADEATAAAAILLQRRIDGAMPSVPA